MHCGSSFVWTLVGDLKWKHPAMFLFYCNVTVGAWGLHLERHSGIEVGRGRGWPLVFLLFGLVVLSWSPLFMIGRPDAWLPARTFTTAPKRYESYKRAVRAIGYAIAIVILLFL